MQSPDRPPDSLPDAGADDRWMTFAELAVARGISKASAARLVRRRRWRRQSDNTGHVRVLVPRNEIDGRPVSPRDSLRDNPRDIQSDDGADIRGFVAAINALTNRTVAAETQANAAQTALEAERAARLAAEAEAQQAVRAAEARIASTLGMLREAAEALKAARAAESELRAAEHAARAEAEEATQAAEMEAAKLRRELEQATTAAQSQASAAERPNMVASRIDEAQLRRLQEAEQARRSMGRMARLRLAWRGE